MQKAVNSAGMFMVDPIGQQTPKFSAAATQQFYSYLPQEMTSGVAPSCPPNPIIAPYISQHHIPMSYIQEEPTQLRKLFIGGLNHDTTDDQLKEYYSKWGQVVDCIVIRDPATKHSRGFGFVTYATIKMAELAMDVRPHIINGKVVDPKRAIPREHMLPLTPSNPPHFLVENEPAAGCKLTLSGVDWIHHTIDSLRQYFKKFGEVEQVEIVGHPRGYGFIVFEDRSSAESCLKAGSRHAVNGKNVEVKECSTNAPPSSALSSGKRGQSNKNQRGLSPDHRSSNRTQHKTDSGKKSDNRPSVPSSNSIIDFPHLD